MLIYMFILVFRQHRLNILYLAYNVIRSNSIIEQVWIISLTLLQS